MSVQQHSYKNVADGTYLPRGDDSSFSCGKQRLLKPKPTQIIGGTPTALQEFPFAVLLVYYDLSGDKKYSCGGSLINRQVVRSLSSSLRYFFSKVLTKIW
jgi:hypothetical protein